ncbi:vWA domain-containing protein [Halalkaliarchaeum desulfuricum]|nr:vWA domain-containing protein [Halalkaliarchaeum desulfuricum]
MTNDNQSFGLSRRKVLAGLGMVGVASAGAGLGTTAYFSDEESFEGNTLTAGELDLLMDYRITYNGGPGRLEELQALYDDDPNYNPEVQVKEFPEGSGNYVLDQVPRRPDYPEPNDWVEAANVGVGENGEISGFEREELTDAGFPLFKLEDVKPGDYGEATISFHLFDNPAYMWMGGGLRENANNGVNDPEQATLDELGYEETTNDDPEDFAAWAEDEDALYYNVDGDWGGQLADAIEARVWYDDNCNNIFDEGGDGEPVDISLVIDVSGSMTYEIGNPDNVIGQGEGSRIAEARKAAIALANNLREDVGGSGLDDRLGVVTFGGIDEEEFGLTEASDVAAIVDDLEDLESYEVGQDDPPDAPFGISGTNIGAGLYGGRHMLDTQGTPDRRPVIILLGDGAPTWSYESEQVDGSTESGFPSYGEWQGWVRDDKLDAMADVGGNGAADDTISVADEIKDETDYLIITIGFGLEEVGQTGLARTTLVEIASPGDGDDGNKLFFESPADVDLVAIFAQIAQVVFGEKVIAEGSLREVLAVLEEGYALDSNQFTEGQDCFPPLLTRCVGFEWWLPTDVGNEVQTDSVMFDIDFYAEQCRHNDDPQNPFA